MKKKKEYIICLLYTSSHSVEESDHGIGISNMRERVEALGGTLNIRQKNGFRIFATVRKEMEETE